MNVILFRSFSFFTVLIYISKQNTESGGGEEGKNQAQMIFDLSLNIDFIDKKYMKLFACEKESEI